MSFSSDETSTVPSILGPRPRRRQRLNWIIVFADLSLLLLTFFVLLFSMSEPDEGDFRAIATALSQRLAPEQDVRVTGPSADVTIERFEADPGFSPGYLERVLRSAASDTPALADMQLTRLSDRLVVTLPADLLFDTNAAALRPSAREALATLIQTLNVIDNPIEVVGHTDPRPVRGGPFSDNWHLSIARAEAVAGALRGEGYEGRMTILGHADGQPPDGLADAPQDERYRLARRVDIIILEDRARSER